MFRRVEECNVRTVSPRSGGPKVALLTDDGRVAPLRFVEAGLVDLKSVRPLRKLFLGVPNGTYIPADLARAPFDLGEDFRVALCCSALVE